MYPIPRVSPHNGLLLPSCAPTIASIQRAVSASRVPECARIGATLVRNPPPASSSLPAHSNQNRQNSHIEFTHHRKPQ
eukprot:3881167-Rhodomonas_salina.1